MVVPFLVFLVLTKKYHRQQIRNILAKSDSYLEPNCFPDPSCVALPVVSSSLSFLLTTFFLKSVSSSSGLIKTALPGMDREVKENYEVVIQAKDMAGQMGGLSGTTTVSITLTDVNDNPPRFTKSELSPPGTCKAGEWGQAVVPAPPSNLVSISKRIWIIAGRFCGGAS